SALVPPDDFGNFDGSTWTPGPSRYTAYPQPAATHKPFRIPPGTPGPGELVATISIDEKGFDPPYIMAPIGTTFYWINDTVATHSVTHDEGDFDVVLPPGATHSEYCVDPGEYPYHCRFHDEKGDNVVNLDVSAAQFLASYRGQPIPSPGPTIDPSYFANAGSSDGWAYDVPIVTPSPVGN
ncbi:MAG: cupredoxin domain-containing protein, partial [Cyanobacteria bacterium REEB65]|nr:cupredoxin domain-containing protein [Cyanobacteria bacterium REEB65]